MYILNLCMLNFFFFVDSDAGVRTAADAHRVPRVPETLHRGDPDIGSVLLAVDTFGKG